MSANDPDDVKDWFLGGRHYPLCWTILLPIINIQPSGHFDAERAMNTYEVTLEIPDKPKETKLQ